MTITITAFERSPDGGKGLARDTRVRWALEEVGEPYQRLGRGLESGMGWGALHRSSQTSCLLLPGVVLGATPAGAAGEAGAGG